jgi:hypothetical protein
MLLIPQSFILADVPPPESLTQNFSYCVKIANLNKYPDRLFFFHTFNAEETNSKPSAYKPIRTNSCIDLEHNSAMRVFTIPRNKLSKQEFKMLVSNGKLTNSKLQKLVVKSSAPIERPNALAKSNEGKKIAVTYQIKSIDSTELNLTLTNNPISNSIVFPLLGLALLLGWIGWRHYHNYRRA